MTAASTSATYSLRTPAPPAGVTLEEQAAWQAEFGRVPPGWLSHHDVPTMLSLVKELVESEHAHASMLQRNRSRDSTMHWQNCMAKVIAFRRALRLTPQSRIRADKSNVAANNFRSYNTAGGIQPADLNSERGEVAFPDWQSMFPPDPSIER